MLSSYILSFDVVFQTMLISWDGQPHINKMWKQQKGIDISKPEDLQEFVAVYTGYTGNIYGILIAY